MKRTRLPLWSPRLLPPLLLAAAATLTHAQAIVGPSPTDWNSLSPAQRTALAPLASDWRQITPGQQQKWLEVANRYGAMSPEERGRIQQRMGEWSRLPAPERARARLNFQEARQLSPAERQQQWEAYRALPPDQRRALAERARAAQAAPPAVTGRPPTAASPEKSSLVRSPALQPATPVGPTVVQRGSGATTSLVSKRAQPPLHQQAGLPKVAATPGFVDAETLLPQRGAQGAAARPLPRDAKSDKSDKGDKDR